MKRLLSFWLVLQLFIQPIYADQVILGGESIGIQIQFLGVLITGTYEVNLNDIQYDPMDADIQKGDLIVAVNDQKISSIAQFSQILAHSINQNVTLTLKRNHEVLKRELYVQSINHQIRSGLFLKDEVLGIGTLTFIHPQTYTFASLGHEVLNQETQQIVPIGQGHLFTSQVVGIKKASLHQVGEKQAQINFGSPLGFILKNNMYGIYGHVEHVQEKETIETALPHEVQLGPAIMFTVLEKEKVERVEILITHLNPQSSKDIKGFEFQILDKKCLHLTNGIVQGMSGSPIVQNDKLVGAVTHVSALDAKQGYGIYIEWMLEESKSDLYRQ